MADLDSSTSSPVVVDPPLLDQHHFLFKKVLNHSPVVAKRFCRALQKKWVEEFGKDDELSLKMKEFKKTRCIHLVWVSDKFGGSLPEDISEIKTYRLLSDIYDSCVRDSADLCSDVPSDGASTSHPVLSHAEKDRKSERQLRQHLTALLRLLRAAERKEPLSEELVKSVHLILMNDLVTGDGEIIHAGQYRRCSVSAGLTHTYPDYKSVPSTVERIVKEYEKKFNTPEHNPLHLAAWLLFELLSIHPFEDGNGRLSRLFWCYSLLRDGLPFPLTPFPEHSKAYRKYLLCIERDREISLRAECKHLTSLTLISVTTTWKNFVVNLRNETYSKYQEVVTWLEESGNALTPLEQ